MSEEYDVIVVGSGPGGASAAYFLGEAGMKVLVIEKEALPRYKTCGGGISLKMLEQFPFSFDGVIESRAQAVLYTFGEDAIEVPLVDRSIGMVMRSRFDAHILTHAKADVWTQTPVCAINEKPDSVEVLTKDRKPVIGRYLIGADGANSIVAHSLALRKQRRMAAAIEVEVDAPVGVMQNFASRPLFSFGTINKGYSWVFPKSDHLSVGIGGFRPKPGELQAALELALKPYGICLNGEPRHGHPIPIDLHREKISTARALLVGDAAGLVDPFTGEGIRFAIQSGRMAAESIIRGDVCGYEGDINRKIRRSHAWGLGLAQVFYLIPEICYVLGVRNPSASKAFSEMLAGQVAYPEVIFRLFATLPVHLGREIVSIISGGEKAVR